MDRMFVSIKEACRTLSLGRSTVYRMIAANERDTIKIGNRRLIKLASLKALERFGEPVALARSCKVADRYPTVLPRALRLDQ